MAKGIDAFPFSCQSLAMQSLDPKIENYCLEMSSSVAPLLRELAQKTQQTQDCPQMLVGELEGGLLRFLVGLTHAKRVLEIGTFTGYSALFMAENLPADGELVTIDINPITTELAQAFWQKAPAGKKIHAKLGPALEVLPQLSGFFDLIFLDADKTNYLAYLKLALPKLAPQGLIVADNCLWSGKVLDAAVKDPDTQALREFNSWVKEQTDFEKILLPIRDGIFLIRKR